MTCVWVWFWAQMKQLWGVWWGVRRVSGLLRALWLLSFEFIITRERESLRYVSVVVRKCHHCSCVFHYMLVYPHWLLQVTQNSRSNGLCVFKVWTLKVQGWCQLSCFLCLNNVVWFCLHPKSPCLIFQTRCVPAPRGSQGRRWAVIHVSVGHVRHSAVSELPRAVSQRDRPVLEHQHSQWLPDQTLLQPLWPGAILPVWIRLCQGVEVLD